VSVLVVIENPEECPLCFTGIEPLPARDYLADTALAGQRGARVFNICQSYRYQSIGYYVSLLAEARGHKAVPSITTIQDMKSVGLIRLASDELSDLVQKLLAGRDPGKLSLYAYFGKNPDKALDPLALRLFQTFPAPFIRADFSFSGGWQLVNVSPASVKDIPAEDHAFAAARASEHFAGRKLSIPKKQVSRFDLAILADPKEQRPPSDPRALKRFARAAEELGMSVEFITRDDSARLSEFDGLFIRETTSVDHHTYRMARKAAAEGLVVIDDPQSIMRCTNKVFLAEVLSRRKVPIPRTAILHSRNLAEVLPELGLPCILKEPDSSFSQGVFMARDWEVLAVTVRRMLKKSELIIAQEFLPTDFDWRVGVLDNRALYVCKYFMAPHHWQILGKGKGGRDVYGRVETMPVAKAPKAVVRTALKAAEAIGDGLYGVDLKQVGNQVYVIEVNDNPSIEAGAEDDVLGMELYQRIMEVFLARMRERTRGDKP
jgi:glutathione synthase/RimK-type ligase-like ATP-grasp enzyme